VGQLGFPQISQTPSAKAFGVGTNLADLGETWLGFVILLFGI